MKRITLLLLMGFLWSWCGSAQIPIGSQADINSSLPILSCYNYSYSQQIVYQSEIDANGDITSISFFFDSSTTGNTSSSGWTIYLGHTAKTEFANKSDWVDAADLTQVFSGTVSYPADGNWMEITFDTAFTYNNIDNLVVAVDENEPGFDCSNFFGITADLGAKRSINAFSDQNNPDPTSPPEANNTFNFMNTMILGGIQQACPFPTNLAVTATTTTTADVEWTENGTATEWEVVYGPLGFDPTTGGTTVTDDDGTPGITLTGLTPSSDYDFYVRAICGASEQSVLAGPASFATDCAPSDVPYLLTFETGANCISTENLGVGQGWKIVTDSNNGFDGTYARYYFSSEPADAWLYTNGVNLETGVNYQISYTYGNNSTAYTEKMDVFMGTEPGAADMTIELADHPEINDATPHTNIVTFTVPADDVYYFGFHAYSDTNQYFLQLDDINVTVAPDCPSPTALTVDGVTENSVDVSWTAGASETEWEVLYGEEGFDPTSAGTVIEVDTDPETTITGLNPSTSYDFYVTAICGVGDESELVGPASFMTTCVPGDVPFFDGFESGYVDQDPLAGCWSQTSVIGSDVWLTNNTETQYNRTPRTGDWNITLKYNNEDWIYYALNLDGGTAYELKFYATQDASSGASVEAAYGTEDNPAAMTTNIIPTSAVVSGGYQEFSGIFTPASTGVYYIGIKGKTNFIPWYLSIDDISVEVGPDCLKPTDLVVNATSETTADLSWTPGGTETEWEVLYGEAGFDPTSAGTVIEVDTDPETTITGLTASTEYEFYVTSICGVGEESEMVGPVSFSTLCGPTTIPYVMDFETAIVPNVPECTTTQNLGTGNNWKTGTNNSNGMSGINLQYGYHSSNPANAWFYTQGIEMETGVTYQISYNYFGSPSWPEKMKVAFGTSPDVSAMTEQLADYPNIDGAGEALITFTVNTNGVYYFGFNVYSDANQNYLYVDNINIIEAPTCSEPTDLIASNITIDSADLSWTPGDVETEWTVIYGESGFDPTTQGTEVNVTTDPETTVNGLDANTEYDFYVTAICGVGEESEMVGPVTFTTLCGPTTVPYALDFEEVTIPELPACTSVQNVGNGNNWETASASGNGFSGQVLRYKYNSSNPANTWFYTQGLDLVAGTTYEISYKFGNNATSFTESMKVAYGTSPDAAAMTEELADYPAITGGTPTEEAITFTVDTDGVYYFGFNAYSATNEFYLYLDDISIVEAAACEAPTDVAVSDITENGATVTWTASTTATEGYTVDVYLEGADPNTATPEVTETVGAGVTTVDVTGLDADTSYDVYVTSLCGGGDTAMSSAVNFTTDETTGINGNDLTQVSYFPNPVKDELTVIAGKSIDNITVYNLLGQTVLTAQPKGTNAVVDMSGLPTGTYVLKANVADAVSTFKVVKQ